MSETIRLIGGPKDGQIVGHQGGDWLYCVSMEPLPISFATPPSAPVKADLKHHVYRRSETEPNTFVYTSS